MSRKRSAPSSGVGLGRAADSDASGAAAGRCGVIWPPRVERATEGRCVSKRPPARQLQIDFGETRVSIGGEVVKLHLFVATLGYSRRVFVRAFRHERQSAWFDGMETAFGHFGGLPQEVLFDNARALVEDHDAATREVRFNERLHGFARYWGFRPRACAPYRARTKGKDERGVGYVKHNAIAGRRFDSWAAELAACRWVANGDALLLLGPPEPNS